MMDKDVSERRIALAVAEKTGKNRTVRRRLLHPVPEAGWFLRREIGACRVSRIDVARAAIEEEAAPRRLDGLADRSVGNALKLHGSRVVIRRKAKEPADDRESAVREVWLA